MANEQTREIMLTSFIIYPIPNLWPAGIQARNNDRKLSLSDLITWPRTPTSIKYRLQSHPSLLRAILRSAHLAVLCSSALLASVSQGQVSSNKAILCQPCTDRSMMTRSGLCACTMTLAGIDLPPGPAVHPSHSTAQPYSCPQGQTSGNPQCDSGPNRASKSTFPGPMCVYNGPEHGTASSSPCFHRSGN
jgi:hypothetical protein